MAGVCADRVIERAVSLPGIGDWLLRAPIHVIAVGKAAPAMATALLAKPQVRARTALAIGTHAAPHMPASLRFLAAGHPFPDAHSRAAARAALEIASRVPADGHLVLLVSGGASSLMADAADGLPFEAKLAASRALMLAGADIHQLNALRKHLSTVKGGRLAAACMGATTTLALSDVVGDDLSVIGSGPGIPDPSTWEDVARALEACGAWDAVPAEVRTRVEAGCRGTVEETPKPDAPDLARASGVVIGGAGHALEAAGSAAEALGYAVITMPDRVTGEAREVGPRWLDCALALARRQDRQVCVLSSGETTVRVRGDGVGGRNLEFMLALVEPMRDLPDVMAASLGTDGVDGSSDVAGAMVDGTTWRRAAARGLPPVQAVLDRNDSYHFFSPLGDTLRTGRTDTNVGDIQVLLVHP